MRVQGVVDEFKRGSLNSFYCIFCYLKFKNITFINLDLGLVYDHY